VRAAGPRLRSISVTSPRRARVIVHGRVQGVFFRAEASSRARSLGLAGWVRNLPDGSVEAVFEGAQELVESMVRWCEHGPAGADVASLHVEWEQPVGDTVFELR
jgi:acylphosphatase